MARNGAGTEIRPLASILFSNVETKRSISGLHSLTEHRRETPLLSWPACGFACGPPIKTLNSHPLRKRALQLGPMSATWVPRFPCRAVHQTRTQPPTTQSNSELHRLGRGGRKRWSLSIHHRATTTNPCPVRSGIYGMPWVSMGVNGLLRISDVQMRVANACGCAGTGGLIVEVGGERGLTQSAESVLRAIGVRECGRSSNAD